MANMFKCALAGGGDGASLIVTCTQNFAGSTITLTNGVKTYTQVCPLSSPYEVIFESVATGVWTVSGIAQGQTFSTSVTITDFEALLADIPEGSTATPTDDIQIWLHCANIWDKAYTTISQVLADASTLQALIASNNAADYMARSTTWANDVTADSSAMTYIGLNNYCADALLSDSTWLNAICNSSYFESVLNVKVPTMTSNTTPSGQAFGSDGLPAWYAFDKSSNRWYGNNNVNQYVGYRFTQNVAVYRVDITPHLEQGHYTLKNFKIQSSNNNSNYNDEYSGQMADAGSIAKIILNNPTKTDYWRLFGVNAYTGFISVDELQFYGRA